MKFSGFILCSSLFLVSATLSPAQEIAEPPEIQFNNTSTEEELIGKEYITAFDSLMDSYYMQKYALGHTRHTKDEVSEAFDNVQDSVIIRRLQSLHTIIPMTYNNEVRAYIRMYLRIMSSRLDVMLTLSEFYHPLFEEALTRNGVPEELKYLSIVESAMNPMATSRVGAAGLWQFMYSTGKLYGLEVNSIIDDRRDPYKSTVAAARYLKDLHSVFNDWTLAIAAYNCGPGNINKAIARSGGKREFWQIYPYLPRETRGYIPAFIAATYVMNFYRDHGLDASEFELPIHSDTITLHHNVLFCHIEQATGVSREELRTLNPQYRTDYIPASSGAYSVCLPTKYMQTFIANEDSIYHWTQDSLSKKPIVIAPAKGSSNSKKGTNGGTRYHTVKKGETLYSVARKYGTTVKALKNKNKNIKGDKISVGQKIRVK
ncbi:MAG: transglycosylase SLT domain-containing protein [Bacteroidales bacterium]|nr:transglycosylase SLT domain-containing protein [Bacteroidales bacterium]